MSRVLLALVVAVLAAAPAGAQEVETVTFDGESFAGTMYFNAGSDVLNTELYRARGSLAAAERITEEGRVSIITGHRGRLAVSNALGTGSDRLELARLDRRSVLPGRLIHEAGQSPSYSPHGRLLWHVVQYTRKGGIAGENVWVSNAAGNRRRVALRLRKSNVDVGWGPGERIAVVRRSRPRIVLDPGGPRQAVLRPRLRRVFQFETSVRGAVFAYGGGATAVIRRNGRQRLYDTDWYPLTWSPDGRTILMANDANRLGLLSLADGTVREIGGATQGVGQAVWVR